MKALKTILMSASLGLTLTSASAGTNPANYLAAEIISINPTQEFYGNQQKVEITYTLPCGSKLVDVVETLKIHGSPANPGADFSINLGVVLSTSAKECEPESEIVLSRYFNTMAVEGKFLGFNPIQPIHVLSSGLPSASQYVVNSEVTAVKFGLDGNDEITLSYKLPCWATLVEVAQTLNILGHPMDLSADSNTLLSVIVEGNPAAMCVDDNQIRSVITYAYSAHAEGSFLGYETVRGQ